MQINYSQVQYWPHVDSAERQESLAKIGVVLVVTDGQEATITLPDDWRTEVREESESSDYGVGPVTRSRYLIDVRGRIRGVVVERTCGDGSLALVDAAVECRYSISFEYEVFDQVDKTVLFKVDPMLRSAQEQCERWLRENRPDWRDPAAYWDD